MSNIVIIEESTFNEMLTCFAAFVSRVEVLCEKHREKGMEEFLDSQDVCTILNIGTRALQTYREKEIIGYSQIERKIFYRNSDVQRLLEKHIVNNSSNYKTNK